MSEDFDIRKNITLVSENERDNFRRALVTLNTDADFRFCGDRNDKPFAGGVSYWFKQDEIHQATDSLNTAVKMLGLKDRLYLNIPLGYTAP